MLRKSSFTIVCFLSIFSLLVGCTEKSEVQPVNTEQSVDTDKANEEKNTSTENSEKEVTNQNKSDFKVTLLGTGSPIISSERFSNSTLVEVAGQKLLFDVGRGTSIRLNEMGVAPGMIDKLFITHLHHDHTMGFDDVLITGAAVPDPRGLRENRMQVWGPKGTEGWINHTLESYEADIEVRKKVEGASLGMEADVQEIEEGVVYENDGVEVIAFKVDHGPMEPAFGYRINYNGHSVVISGDTTYSENLIEYAQGTDLLIQEVVVVKATPEEEYKSEALKNIEAYHTTPEQAGEIFKKVKPKLAVYTHLALAVPEKEAKIKERTEKIYDGEVVVGEDLMSIVVGEDIKIQQP
ncbi:MBL fold metallo-hydrolase [Peribacillus asahii]|uniref:MBL fold metallo-hydrolase n=1 Tax=Peribacillus asahii TaxID=228899 RepID=UPI00207AFC97|nr:MBL fold metallo-hydrolase [Peribacillus asahii]USK87564.1 MBL fold metallo-hydrolase [Peribacillus asahii]